MRGRSYPSEVRAAVVAEIAGGDSIRGVAKRYDIPWQTAQSWWIEVRPVQPDYAHAREVLGAKTFVACCAILDGITAIARQTEDPEWLKGQSADSLAQLSDGWLGRVTRLLAGLAPPDDGTVASGSGGDRAFSAGA